MNKFLAIGRATDEPNIKYNDELCIARYTLAVERNFKKDGENGADFIRCVAFGKNGQWAEKYLTKGKKIAIEGRINTGSYEKDGQKINTYEIIVERAEFIGRPEERSQSESYHNYGDYSEAKPYRRFEDELPWG